MIKLAKQTYAGVGISDRMEIKMKILVVDDEREIRNVLRLLF